MFNFRDRLTENLPNLERANSRGDLRMDSDDGITSDDGFTDNDDSGSVSFEVSGMFVTISFFVCLAKFFTQRASGYKMCMYKMQLQSALTHKKHTDERISVLVW